MHIPDGFVPPQLCILGYGLTGGLTWYSLRQIKHRQNSYSQIPKASLLTAAFFVASTLHIPLPPASVHLVLNGLMGVVLGYYAIPAILIGLFFQAVMFHHGGLSTLGINTIILGIPALVAHFLFQLRNWQKDNRLWGQIVAFISGAGGTILSALLFATIIILTLPPDIDSQVEKVAITTFLIAQGIVSLVEGGFVAMVVAFVEQVKPELLQFHR